MSLHEAPAAADAALRRELTGRLAAAHDLPDAIRLGVTREEVRACLDAPAPNAGRLAAWVVTRFLRPVVPVIEDQPGEAEARVWHRRLALSGRELTRAARAVGRIELEGHPGLAWAGTCWLVTPDVAVTTRTVALQFCHADSGRLALGLRGGPALRATVRFEAAAPRAIARMLAVDTGPFGADLAFLVLDGPAGDPLALGDRRPEAASLGVALGYPGTTSRARAPLARLVYRDPAGTQCAAPGALQTAAAGALLRHDAATVGDWAGALLLDLATGRAAGIHLAGALDGPGLAIQAADIATALRAVGVTPPPAAARAPTVDDAFFERRTRSADDYVDRRGYREDFLGIAVPAPKARAALREDVLPIEAARGRSATLLPYTHFSVCMSKARRMCLYTACNVHGGRLRDLGRAGIPWQLDPRLEDEMQAGDELYVDNDLDRGHMVRRLDPVWGADAEAEQANIDTFHFTNSCPQHKDLNQKVWNDLEDYVLDNAGKHELKLNVFTGPVFRDDDPEYRDFRLPVDFWKVVVMVKDDGALSATAYRLSQVDLVTGLEFVFGKFRTYQVRIRDVEEWTSLDFGDLRTFDPKEFHESAAPVPIEGPRDIVL